MPFVHHSYLWIYVQYLPLLNLIQCSVIIIINAHKYNILWAEECTTESILWFTNICVSRGLEYWATFSCEKTDLC